MSITKMVSKISENLDFTQCDSTLEDKQIVEIKKYIKQQLQQAIKCTETGDWYGLHKALAEVEFYKHSAISRELDLEAERQREQEAKEKRYSTAE